MSKTVKLNSKKFYIEITAASILFLYALLSDNMIMIIVNLLYFIIFLEIVRIVINFIEEKRIKIRILIDTFIILTLREFIVNVVKINKENFSSIADILTSSTNSHILIFSGVLIFLFALRWIAVYTSPDNDIKDIESKSQN